MAAHAVTGDADAARIEFLKGGEERLGELLGDVRVHFVVLRPGLLCGVDVEARAGSEVVCVIFALNLETSCLSKGIVSSHKPMMHDASR